jgi:hypothetical protein
MSNNESVPYKIEKPFLLLCEGQADKIFFKNIIQKRLDFSEVDIPEFENFPNGQHNFGKMLRSIRGDQYAFQEILKGIIIVSDSTDNPKNQFKNICTQIKEIGGFEIPKNLLEPAYTKDSPGITVMTLPDEETTGCLETLCIRAIIDKNPWIESCLDSFLKCEKIEVNTWSAEKKDKARYQCLVAALNKKDPSKTLSYAFNGNKPFIDINSSRFDNVAENLKRIINSIHTPSATHKQTCYTQAPDLTNNSGNSDNAY